MGSCAAPSAKGDDKFITTDYLQQCPVARLMAVMGLAGVLRGKKVRTTVSRKAVAAGDRVNRQFVAERSDQLWVADFTYGVPGVQGGHGCLNEPRVCLEY